MGRIICITCWTDQLGPQGRPTGRKELVVSHGINEDTGRTVILPCEPPAALGATLDRNLNEWVLDGPDEA